jgi:two-component system, OmpR family, sensor histidine kinase BaeS
VTTRAAQPLAWRLSLAIVAVVVAVIALYAALMYLVTRSDINSFNATRVEHVEQTLTAAAAFAYTSGDGWPNADVQPVVDLARDAGIWVRVVDNRGTTLARGGAVIDGAADAELLPIRVHTAAVGTLVLTFPRSVTVSGVALLRQRLLVASAAVGVIAVLLGVAVAVVVARRLTRPIGELTAAVHAVNEGATDVRVGNLSSSTELQELGAGFDAMAATLERQDRLRRSLVADAAHELRTPLSVLQASCEAVVDGVATPSRELATSMLQQVHRLGQRIADLDALASAESAGLRLTRSPVAIDEVVLEVAESMRPRFDRGGVALTTTLAPATVLGDRDRLHQVITNLLVNAAKFTPPGGSVHVSVRRQGEEAVVGVTDTGTGIEQQELEHVFDRFWRGRGSTGTPGSGVGLAIVAELVRAHRGTITVRSDVGRGTEFEVRLPLT